MSESGNMATTEEPTVHQLLVDTLDDLSKEDFEKFKFFLMDKVLLKEFGTIPKNLLETEERTMILKAMMDTYENNSIAVTKKVLQLIPRNDLLEDLSQWNYDPEAIFDMFRLKLKSKLTSKFKFLIEGIKKKEHKMLFNDGYTELFVTMDGTGQVTEEHEFAQIKRHSRKQVDERTIHCQDIFNDSTISEDPIRVVLTKGVAGVGKTVLTQKFSLDWAEGRTNQDIHLLFPFTFRELNVLTDKFSLVGLLQHFFSESKGLCSFQHLQVVFIFDGLDEFRLPLDFTQTRVLTKVTESGSVDVLLVNLIRGSLLPSARLWITTRPAAANQIIDEFVSMVTEVRGFTDPQKEQYFRKRFRDEEQATAVIKHIKTSHSLYNMCYIPVFCWIISTVLENIIETTEQQELPKTLTNLYIHFLVVQLKTKNVKYDQKLKAASAWSPENKKMVESLGKLAFEQLQKGNLIFYESDLSQCGLEPTAASVYSGVFTHVFREEPGLYQDMVYCFIHLSIQEFMAALHVHQTFFNSKDNLLSAQQTSESPGSTKTKTTETESNSFMTKLKLLIRRPIQTTEQTSESPEAFYCSAVDQALQSPNGHLDLFLRFLLGLSLSTNQSLLQGLLTQTGSEPTNQETAEYIKKKLSEDVSTERSISLLHCLNELNDRSLVQQIQQYLRSGHLSKGGLSPAQWSALAFILLSSEEHLDVFELKKYCASEEALLRLLPVVKASNKALLSHCELSDRSCGALSSVLSSSSLRVLDLSNNPLKDSGVELLCVGLKSPHCKLETLRLSHCLISEEGCASLASALRSNPSLVRELDLSYNHPGDTGVQLLCALQEDPHCSLESVRLNPAGKRWLRPMTLNHHDLTLDPNTASRWLTLSDNNKNVTLVKEKQSYPDHQDRFEYVLQLLCSTGLTGRCYWEVQWSGKVYISVSYRRIKRKGRSDDSGFGFNDQSWSLECSNTGYSVWHNAEWTDLPHSSSSSGTVAVYVDVPAGSLSFYTVSSGKLKHLHTFNTTFTEPLFPGFWLWYEHSSVTLC